MKKLSWLIILVACCCFCGCCKSELEKKAETGDVQAQYEFAQECKKKKDFESMVKWLEKSANKGFLKAQESIAMDCFLFGDRALSLKWAQETADKDSKIGKSVLAYYCYWGGKDFAVDRIKALKLAEETKDIPLSKAMLACFHKTGFWGVEKDIEKAEKLAKESMEEGCPEGGAVLSNIYADSGRNKDAQDVLNKGLDIGYTDAIISKIMIDLKNNKIGLEDAYNKLEKYTKINSCLAYEARARIAGAMVGCEDYILQIGESKTKQFNNLKKAFYAGSCNKEVYQELVSFDISKEGFAKFFNMALKTKDPEIFEDLYFFLREPEKRKKFLPPNVSYDDVLKIGADNGSSLLMLIYACKNINNKEVYEKYKNQSLSMNDSKYFLRRLRFMSHDAEIRIRMGLALKDCYSYIIMGKALLNGHFEKKPITKDPKKGFLYLKNGFMAASDSKTAMYVKENDYEELFVKWLNDFPDYKDRIYVFALVCDFENKEKFVKNLEDMISKEKINSLKKEAKTIIDHLNSLS